MKGFRVKHHTAPILMAVDWGREGGEAAEDFGWTVRPSLGAPGELRVRRQALRGGVSRAELVGGRPGEVYLVGASARTDQGRMLRRSMVVRVADH